jgi:hypothetical protein
MTIHQRLIELKRWLIPQSSFAAGIGIGLWLPDVDLVALPILHHRSILTHSIFIPFLISKFFTNRFSLSAVAGLYGGIAIHLSADILSPMVGFGMIWLPSPIKLSLGPFSIVWIAGNALAGAILALKLAPDQKKTVYTLVALVALSYAIFNEGAFWPFVIFGLVATIAMWVHRRGNSTPGVG